MTTQLDGILSDAAQKAISAVEHYAPVAWQMMVRKERIDAAFDMCGGILLALFGIGFTKLAWYLTKDADSFDRPIARVASFLIGTILVIIGLISAYVSIPHLAYPELHAAARLLP